MKTNHSLFLSALILLLSGCIGKTVPSADVYILSPQWNASHNSTAPCRMDPLSIKLAPIRADNALKNTDILYSDSQYKLNAYAYSRWHDSPVNMLQTVLQSALDQCTLFQAVFPATSTAQATLRLETTLYDLSHHLNQNEVSGSHGNIRIRFYLIDARTNQIISTQQFFASSPTPTRDAKGAVIALNNSLTNITDQLVLWLKKSLDQRVEEQP